MIENPQIGDTVKLCDAFGKLTSPATIVGFKAEVEIMGESYTIVFVKQTLLIEGIPTEFVYPLPRMIIENGGG